MSRKESYYTELQSSEWKAKRAIILKRDNYSCCYCGGKEMLHVHHTRYIHGCKAWEYKNSYLQTLCSDCHIKVHKETKIKGYNKKTDKSTKSKKQISRDERDKIKINEMISNLNHKDRVLSERYRKYNK